MTEIKIIWINNVISVMVWHFFFALKLRLVVQSGTMAVDLYTAERSQIQI